MVHRRFNPPLCLLLRFKQEFGELRQQLTEQGEVVFKFGQYALDRVLDAHIKRVALPLLGRPGNGRLRQRINQPTRRVIGGKKKIAVNHGRLEHRNLQAANHELHLHGNGLIGKNEIKYFGQCIHRAPIKFGGATDLVAITHLTQDVVVAGMLAGQNPFGRLGLRTGLQVTQIAHKFRISRRQVGTGFMAIRWRPVHVLTVTRVVLPGRRSQAQSL